MNSENDLNSVVKLEEVKGLTWSWLRTLLSLVENMNNTQELVERVENSFLEFIDCDYAELYLVERKNQDDDNYEFNAIESLARAVFFSRAVIEDIFLNKIPCRIKKNEIVLPLEVDARVIGLLYLKSKDSFSNEDYELLWSFSDKLAAIILDIRESDGSNREQKDQIKEISHSIFNNFKGFIEASIERLKFVEDQNAQLVKLNETRTELINNVSHELRTPLVSIMGFSKILQRQEIKAELILEASEQIQSAGSRLSRMIDDLIQLNRANTKGWEINVEKLDLGEITRFVIESLEPLNKSHNFKTDFPAEYPTVGGDRKLLRQVIENLLINAIKYSPDGGDITAKIAVIEDEHKVELSIADDGIGMSEEENEKIFDRFFRAKNQRTENIPGLGLGLSICKDVIEALNGTISSESEFEKGSIFKIRLSQ